MNKLSQINHKRVNLKRQLGMTLIEVMVALAVFALAAVSVVSVATEHLRSIAYLEQKTLAVWIANNHLSELQLQGKLPDFGIKRGKLEYACNTWYWQQQTEKTADNDFRQVNIRVFNKESSEDALAELSSFMVKK